MRFLERIPNPSLRPQMDDPVERMTVERRRQCREVAEIAADKCEVTAQLRQPVALQLWIIIVVEVVDPDHRLAARQERLRRMKTDKPGDPGDEHRHRCTISAATIAAMRAAERPSP